MSEKDKIYEASKYIKLGIKIWPIMIKELIQSRELAWQLFLRDISTKYKQAILGYLWAFIMPFVIIFSFMFLGKTGVINIGDTSMPYPLFALVGLSVFQLFSTGITSGSSSLVNAGNLLTKINFSKEALVISSIAQSLFEFLIKLFLIFIFFIFYRIKPTFGILFFPFSMIPIIFLTMGLSFILSLTNALIRDISNIVILLTTFLMFLTPVLYLPSEINSFFFKINPLSSLVNAPRDLLVYGYIAEPLDFLIASIFSILLFFISWRIFYVVQTKLPERI